MNRLKIMTVLAIVLAVLGHTRITVYVAGVVPVGIPVLPAILIGVILAAAAACWVACRAVWRWPHLHSSRPVTA